MKFETTSFTGTSATTPVTIPNPGGQSWSNMRGAFMVGNKLVYGWNDSKMYYRTFDGLTYGPAVLIDPYNDPTWSNVSIGGGSSTTYRGRVPTLYTQMNNVVGMAYTDGRIYYYDVNSTSNFVANAEAVLGFDPTARFADFIVSRARREARPAAA